MTAPSLFWFRNDLRISDNPGLFAAAEQGLVLPVYIWDTDQDEDNKLGGASKWWLHQSLTSLMNSGVPLKIFKGKPIETLQRLQDQLGIEHIHWNRQYEPYTTARDKEIKASLDTCHSFNGSLLHEPWDILNGSGEFYKVFTPYWRAAQTHSDPRGVIEAPEIKYYDAPIDEELSLNELDLLPKQLDWPDMIAQHWQPGEQHAQKAINQFVEDRILSYKADRDIPGKLGTSRLSPHLHFGEISPHQIWQAVHEATDSSHADVRTYLSELGWREFSYYLLYHVKNLRSEPFQKKFINMEWEDNNNHFEAWTKGMTGYPMVDAGMRELWQTGYMHNRVRMIVASFLTKHCLIHWTKGERWFWDCLVDADPASNAASWQWVAGCGADAAPFFRIFNPITQSEKFDPSGDYIRKYVPELKGFSDKDIHKPFETSITCQEKANCIIGQDYPNPIIDLKFGRERALVRFKSL